MAKNTREPVDTREGPRSFSVLMAEIADGDFQKDASKELFDLINTMRDAAIDTNGKVKGRLDLRFDISIDPRGVVSVEFDPKAKLLTKIKRAPAMAWITKGGNLTLEHPTQLKLGIREVRGDNSNDDDDARDARGEG